MMAEKIMSKGYYWGYSTTLVINHNGNRLTLSERNNVPINYDIPSDDGGSEFLFPAVLAVLPTEDR